MADPIGELELARRDVGLPVDELWMRYFALGGMNSPLELDAVLNGALVATTEDLDRIAVAINERYAELGGDHPVPYAGDDKDGAGS